MSNVCCMPRFKSMEEICPLCPDQHGEDHLKDKADRHHPGWLASVDHTLGTQFGNTFVGFPFCHMRYTRRIPQSSSVVVMTKPFFNP